MTNCTEGEKGKARPVSPKVIIASLCLLVLSRHEYLCAFVWRYLGVQMKAFHMSLPTECVGVRLSSTCCQSVDGCLQHLTKHTAHSPYISLWPPVLDWKTKEKLMKPHSGSFWTSQPSGYIIENITPLYTQWILCEWRCCLLFYHLLVHNDTLDEKCIMMPSLSPDGDT